MAEKDIIDALKAKEEEMEKVLNEARKTAAEIKEKAMLRSAQLRDSIGEELDIDIKLLTEEEERLLKEELSRLEKESAEAIECLERKIKGRREKAIERIMNLILAP